MTDWLRVLGYTVLGLLILIGLLGVGWIVMARRQLRRYRLSNDETRKRLRENYLGRRPHWPDPESKEYDDVH